MTRRAKRTVLRECRHCKHSHYVVNEPPYECSVYRLPTEPLPDYSARRTGDEVTDAALAAELSSAFRKRAPVDVPPRLSGSPNGEGNPGADLYMPKGDKK